MSKADGLPPRCTWPRMVTRVSYFSRVLTSCSSDNKHRLFHCPTDSITTQASQQACTGLARNTVNTVSLTAHSTHCNTVTVQLQTIRTFTAKYLQCNVALASASKCWRAEKQNSVVINWTNPNRHNSYLWRLISVINYVHSIWLSLQYTLNVQIFNPLTPTVTIWVQL